MSTPSRINLSDVGLSTASGLGARALWLGRWCRRHRRWLGLWLVVGAVSLLAGSPSSVAWSAAVGLGPGLVCCG